jgi:hypothetical protein
MITFRTAAVAVAAILRTTLSACSGSAARGVTIEMNEVPVATRLAGLSGCSQDCSIRVSARHTEVSEQAR